MNDVVRDKLDVNVLVVVIVVLADNTTLADVVDDGVQDGVTVGDALRLGVREYDADNDAVGDVLLDVVGVAVGDGLHVMTATDCRPACIHNRNDDGLVVPWCSSTDRTLLAPLVSAWASSPSNSIHSCLVVASTTVVASVLYAGDDVGMFQDAICWPFRYTIPPSASSK